MVVVHAHVDMCLYLYKKKRMKTCKAITKSGRRCKKKISDNITYCSIHRKQLDSDISPDRLDSMILSSGTTWEALVEYHKQTHSHKTIDINGLQLSVENVLLFVRSLSRVYIDAHVSAHRSIYGLTPDDFQIVAPGSITLTSDYDVTLMGPKAYKCCQQIINTFTSYGSGHLPEITDSNIYIGPAGILFPDKTTHFLPPWLTIYPISSDQYKPVPFFPIPTSQIAIVTDCKSVKRKYDKIQHGLDIKGAYDTMIKYGKDLDIIYYRNITTKRYQDEQFFWNTLGNINWYASEAYAAISTILVVVVELQMGHDLSSHLQNIHYQLCAFENMCDLRDHIGSDTLPTIIDDITLLKYSKYIYRIWYALKRSNDLTPTDADFFDDVKYVVTNIRGSKNPDFDHLSFACMRKVMDRLGKYETILSKILLHRLEDAGNK